MYCFESRIRYSETDSRGRLSIPALIDYFQDCSTFQSEDLGQGIEALKARELVWVLCSWQVEIGNLPGLGEAVEVGTFPYEFKGFLGYRNFFMRDRTGRWLARGNSLWSLLNTATMKPAGLPEDMLEAYRLEERLDMEYLPRRIRMPEDMREKEALEVRPWHLDTNGHVNNGQYIHLADSLLENRKPVTMLRAEYKRQAWPGDVLIPYVSVEENVSRVSFRDRDGNVFVNVEERFDGNTEAGREAEADNCKKS